MEKLPPEEKVYEAWTAIADGRVNLDEAARTATVRSSDGTQTYTIQWDADRREYSGNDNASYWRGYPGYPVIAVMMLQGVLPLDRTMAELYSEVNWRKLNTEYRHNYAASLAETEAVRNIDPEGPVKAAHKVMEKLENLPVKIKRNRTAVIENA